MGEELKHYCGVFGCLSTDDWPTQYDVAQMIYLGLVSLQHRGQECAGIVTSNGCLNSIKVHKARGLISHTFTNDNISSLKGNIGIGHTRYSTQAGTDMVNCQPFVVHASCGPISIAHNGELVNADNLRKKIQARGVGLSTSSDSELIAQMLSIPASTEDDILKPDWETRIISFMNECSISYSLLLMYKDEIWGIRDPYGNRPLCIGKLKNSETTSSNNNVPGVWLVSSESCAFGSMGARIYKEVQPGEIVKITKEGVKSINIVSPPKLSRYLQSPALCLFEYIYFSRSDSIFEGQQLYGVRLRCGQQLAKEAPVLGADLISTVPDSATPAALGFAQESGVPYLEVLTKNPYVGRTFIQPSPHLRKLGVTKKFGVLSDNLKNKKIVLVDDSIVRGTTMQPIIKLLKENGAKEVHVRVSSPPVKYPCFMGINIPTRSELIANKYETHELAQFFGADSVAYLSLEGLKLSITTGLHKNGVTRSPGYCSACFTGQYPVPLEW